jgi:hypothetical protein
MLGTDKQKHTLPPENEKKYSFRNVLYDEYYVMLYYVIFLSRPFTTDSSKLHYHCNDPDKIF